MRTRADAIRLELVRNLGIEPDDRLVATLERALDLVDAGRVRDEVVLSGGRAEPALRCVGRFRLERFVHAAAD